MTFNFLGPGLTVNVEAKVKEQIILDSSVSKCKVRNLAKSLFHAPFSSIYVQGENRDDWNAKFLRDIGASGRTRTVTSKTLEPKSSASTNFATLAGRRIVPEFSK